MNPLDFLGFPDAIGWTIIAIMIIFPTLQLVSYYKFKYSKNCRNCGGFAGKQILCNECTEKYKDLFPHEWKNKK